MRPQTLKQPSAFLPVLMSLTALAIVLLHLAAYGIVREADEGTAAHLWQILMGGQVPIVLYFAAKWLPRAPLDAAKVLALQVALAVAACLPVYFFT